MLFKPNIQFILIITLILINELVIASKSINDNKNDVAFKQSIVEHLNSIQIKLLNLNDKLDQIDRKFQSNNERFKRSTDLNDNIVQRLENELLDSLPVWHQRIESKLNKIMNVAAEIYKEDKLLSQSLVRLNEVQSDKSTQEGADKDVVQSIRKSVQEELSIARVEWKHQFTNLEQQCSTIKDNHDNITFMLLGLKDDLMNQSKSTSGLMESTLDVNEEHAHNLDSSEFNKTMDSFKYEMQQMHQQLTKSMQKENRDLSERLITLVNNYEHLKQLRTNCDSTGRSIESKSNSENNADNELNGNFKKETKTTLKPMHDQVIKALSDEPKMINNDYNSNLIPKMEDKTQDKINYLHLINTNQNNIDVSSTEKSVHNQQAGHLGRKLNNNNQIMSNSIDTRRINRKLIKPVRIGHGSGRNCDVKRNLVAPNNCYELYTEAEARCDGLYFLTIQFKTFRAYCDMEDGGWTVIMRRGNFNNDQHIDFNLDWQAYKMGFGQVNDEFWLGLEQMHKLTLNADQMLRIDLESFAGDQLTLEYRDFRVGDEHSGYELELSDPVNNLNYANQLLFQNGAKFATKDKNGDPFDCPQRFDAGWWFVGQKCHDILLTGSYHDNEQPLFKEGIQWPAWRPKQYLKAVQMKIKPKN